MDVLNTSLGACVHMSLGYIPTAMCILDFVQCGQMHSMVTLTNLLFSHRGMRIPTVVYPHQHLVWSDFLNFCQSDRQMES